MTLAFKAPSLGTSLTLKDNIAFLKMRRFSDLFAVANSSAPLIWLRRVGPDIMHLSGPETFAKTKQACSSVHYNWASHKLKN